MKNKVFLEEKKNKVFQSAITCNNRGAPVKLCNPAPSVDKKDPIKMTHSLGQAMLATTNLPPMLCPNLQTEISK